MSLASHEWNVLTLVRVKTSNEQALIAEQDLLVLLFLSCDAVMSLRLLIILPSVSSANSCHRHTESVPMLCSSPQLRQLNPAVGITAVFCGMLFAAHGQPHNLFKIIMLGFPLLRGKPFLSHGISFCSAPLTHCRDTHVLFPRPRPSSPPCASRREGWDRHPSSYMPGRTL